MGLHECGLPEDKLPQCWYDDVRMNALFAPFRLKSANPESWDMKMKFWSDMLRQWCRVKGDAVISAADAKVAFHRRGRTPACIDIVVEEMYRNGDLVPISKYQQVLHAGPEGWVRWGARLAFKPAAIALTAVSSLMPGRQALDGDGLPKASIEGTQRFVLESVLKEQATSLLNNYPPGMERVGTIDELVRRCEWKAGREAFEIALGWLIANGSAIIKGDVVKLAEPAKRAEEVTKVDEALVSLAQAEARLERDAARLEREERAARADASAQYALGNKPAARNHLRRRHRAEQRLKKCEGALENVKQLLHNLRDVDSNKAIVDTYKTTSEAMKETGIDEDVVHETMDDLRDVMESYNEVEKALSGGIEDLDAAELEDELNELLATGRSGGGAPGEEGVKPDRPARKTPERDFVFDGEERIIAELNELGVDDTSPPTRNAPSGRKLPVSAPQWDGGLVAQKTPEKAACNKVQPAEAPKSKSWYPPSAACLRPDAWNNNFAELRQDERLHPGQTLNIDFTTPPRLYNTDFQVNDHKLDSRVWLYNPRDNTNANLDTLAASTEYFSSESPGKTGGNFQMAPGGERAHGKAHGPAAHGPAAHDPAAHSPTAHGPAAHAWPAAEDATVADIERRLNNLRGFNL